jgi:hypothetical protein
MKKFINAAMLMVVALLLTVNTQAQTATPSPTPERIDLSKEGDLKTIAFTLKEGETKKYAARLTKDKYLYVYFSDPSRDNATTLTNPMVQIDSAQTSFAGVRGSTSDASVAPTTKITWELTENMDKKVFTSSDIKTETPQIPADGEYFITLKCVASGGCTNWLRVKVEKTALPPTSGTHINVEFP